MEILAPRITQMELSLYPSLSLSVSYLERRQLEHDGCVVIGSLNSSVAQALQAQALRGYAQLARLEQLQAGQEILTVVDMFEIQFRGKLQLHLLLVALLGGLSTHHECT